MNPTRLLLLLAALPALASVVTAWRPGLVVAVLVLDGLCLVLAAVDAVIVCQRARLLRGTLTTTPTWSLGRAERIAASVENHHRRRLAIRVLPDLPGELGADGGPVALAAPGHSRIDVAVDCHPQRRGTYAVAGVWVAVTSPLGLWQRTRLLPAQLTVRVYPDLKQISQYALLARTGRLDLIGIRASRHTGGETEFDHLRDRHSDDPLNRMDWRATARRGVLTVRDYRTSQNQNLILMIDAGRMMVSEADGDGSRSLLDLAIDAALMLAWVAIHQGDRVGLLAYADGVRRWIPVRGGQGQVARIVHALHDLHAERVESRHEDAFLHLERQERKRTLVVTMTHILDEVNADHLERHCKRIVGRHLPLAVLLQDHGLHDRLPPAERLGDDLTNDPSALWRAGAAASIIGWRKSLIDRLQRHGCLVLDAPTERLTAGLISSYLEIKARNLL